MMGGRRKSCRQASADDHGWEDVASSSLATVFYYQPGYLRIFTDDQIRCTIDFFILMAFHDSLAWFQEAAFAADYLEDCLKKRNGEN